MSDTGERTYSNIVITWEASTSNTTLKVTVTAGGALIGLMNFTPDTLTHILKYNNQEWQANGTFTVQYNPKAMSGSLSCEDFIWDLQSSSGNISGLIGIWDINN